MERFFDIIQEIDLFFIQKCEQIIILSNPEWINDLAFLVDITRYLNELNTKLQGKDQLITDLFSHINAFKVKLLLFKNHLKNENITHFNTFKVVKERYSTLEFSYVKYVGILSLIEDQFKQRFTDCQKIRKIVLICLSTI